MTISILGCGWLGEPLARRLVENGHVVKGSTTTPAKLERLAGEGVRPYLIRLDPNLDRQGIRDFFEADVLLLNVPPGRRDPAAAERFPKQVQDIREAAGEHRVPLVVFASSTSVYPDLDRVVHEEDAGGDIPAVSQALLDSENALRTDERFGTTVLRFGGLYGYNRQPGRFLAGKRNVENGDAPVNLVHRDDCIEVALQIVEQRISGVVLNVCSDLHPTRRELYTRRAQQLGIAPPTFQEDGARRYKIVSNARLKRLLEYQFLYPDPMQEAP